jgi:heterodisulfide reductase subunit A
VEQEERIQLNLSTEIQAVEGFVGNFSSTLDRGGETTRSTTGWPFLPPAPGKRCPRNTGTAPMSASSRVRSWTAASWPIRPWRDARSAVFIQCVGSREPERPYCSRVCCTHSIESALELKRRNPEMAIYILNRDIRTYGEREKIYTEARQAGIVFIRYTRDNKPEVMSRRSGSP